MKKILIVEDEVKIANTLKKGFDENGFEADSAFDGFQGQTLFNSKLYDLVILDLNIPKLNGIDLCKAIRLKNTQVPIIMFTAKNTFENKIEGYEVGADDYIVKPFEFKELLLKVKAILKRSMVNSEKETSKLVFADVEMNLLTQETKRSGVNIILTAKEFQLLEYFLRNKNRIISRSELAEKVWDITFDTQTNVIDVYINYLRKKIDKTFPTKLIHTQVGAGYILKIDIH